MYNGMKYLGIGESDSKEIFFVYEKEGKLQYIKYDKYISEHRVFLLRNYSKRQPMDFWKEYEDIRSIDDMYCTNLSLCNFNNFLGFTHIRSAKLTRNLKLHLFYQKVLVFEIDGEIKYVKYDNLNALHEIILSKYDFSTYYKNFEYWESLKEKGNNNLEDLSLKKTF